MNEKLPCDDITCWCCYPENMHSCQYDPMSMVPGESVTCRTCGAVWTTRNDRPPHWPEGQPLPPVWATADRPLPTEQELSGLSVRRWWLKGRRRDGETRAEHARRRQELAAITRRSRR